MADRVDSKRLVPSTSILRDDDAVRRGLPYTSCFCEENVYKLGELLQEELILSSSEEMLEHAFVVFISSPSKAFPIWHQKKATQASEPMFWDYHVLLVYAGRVYDHDSTLPWGCTAAEYCTRAIRPSIEFTGADTGYEPIFRLVRLLDYLRHFASDRSHMPPCPAGGEGGAGTPHPAWPLLKGPDAQSAMTLPRYWTMNTSTTTTTTTTIKMDGREIGQADCKKGSEAGAGVGAEGDGPHYGEVLRRSAFNAWCTRLLQQWS